VSPEPLRQVSGRPARYALDSVTTDPWPCRSFRAGRGSSCRGVYSENLG